MCFLILIVYKFCGLLTVYMSVFRDRFLILVEILTEFKRISQLLSPLLILGGIKVNSLKVF